MTKDAYSWTSFYVTVGFYYFSLVRMFCNRKMNNKINHLQERCLRIVCSVKMSSFGKLLETDLYHQCAARLSKEIKDLTPTIFSEFFSKLKMFNISCVTLLSYLFQIWEELFIVTKSLSYLATKIWDLVPRELRELSSLGAFKKAIKKWKPQNCLCKISVLFDLFSDILDFFNIYVLVPKNFISICIY